MIEHSWFYHQDDRDRFYIEHFIRGTVPYPGQVNGDAHCSEVRLLSKADLQACADAQQIPRGRNLVLKISPSEGIIFRFIEAVLLGLIPALLILVVPPLARTYFKWLTADGSPHAVPEATGIVINRTTLSKATQTMLSSILIIPTTITTVPALLSESDYQVIVGLTLQIALMVVIVVWILWRGSKPSLIAAVAFQSAEIVFATYMLTEPFVRGAVAAIVVGWIGLRMFGVLVALNAFWKLREEVISAPVKSEL